jgi:hypothetical protein
LIFCFSQGRFQNSLIIYTLAHAHFSEFDEIPDPRQLSKDERPVGALILALQAVSLLFLFRFISNSTCHLRLSMLSSSGKLESLLRIKAYTSALTNTTTRRNARQHLKARQSTLKSAEQASISSLYRTSRMMHGCPSSMRPPRF